MSNETLNIFLAWKKISGRYLTFWFVLNVLNVRPKKFVQCRFATHRNAFPGNKTQVMFYLAIFVWTSTSKQYSNTNNNDIVLGAPDCRPKVWGTQSDKDYIWHFYIDLTVSIYDCGVST